jgi:hypothetical protein
LTGACTLQRQDRSRVLVEVLLEVNVVLGVAVVVVEHGTGAAEKEKASREVSEVSGGGCDGGAEGGTYVLRLLH